MFMFSENVVERLPLILRGTSLVSTEGNRSSRIEGVIGEARVGELEAVDSLLSWRIAKEAQRVDARFKESLPQSEILRRGG